MKNQKMLHALNLSLQQRELMATGLYNKVEASDKVNKTRRVLHYCNLCEYVYRETEIMPYADEPDTCMLCPFMLYTGCTCMEHSDDYFDCDSSSAISITLYMLNAYYESTGSTIERQRRK